MNELDYIKYSQEYYHFLLERYEELRKILIFNYTRYHYENEDNEERGIQTDPFFMEFHELLKQANNRLVARLESLKFHCQCDVCNYGNQYAMVQKGEEYAVSQEELDASQAKMAAELQERYKEFEGNKMHRSDDGSIVDSLGNIIERADI